MRLEADYWGHEESRVLPELLSGAKWVGKHVHSCITQHNSDNSRVSYPLLYLSSGLFGNKNASKVQQQHGDITLQHLRDLGSHTSSVTWRQRVIDGIIASGSHHDIVQDRHLLPEQLALIDMEVARRAPCFVPSHIGSSFSYMITRRRDLDQGKLLTFAQVHKVPEETGGHGVSHDFKHWGI